MLSKIGRAVENGLTGQIRSFYAETKPFPGLSETDHPCPTMRSSSRSLRRRAYFKGKEPRVDRAKKLDTADATVAL